MKRFCILALLFLAVSPVAHTNETGVYPIDDCFLSADTVAANVCRVAVAAAYQSLQLVQVRYGMHAATCQFGVDADASHVIDALEAELSVAGHRKSADIVVLVALGALQVPVTCHSGIATTVGGMTGAQFVNLCKAPTPAGGIEICLSYIAAIRDALVGLSGADGAADFTCPSSNTIDAKTAAHLYLEQLKQDHGAKLKRPVADVMADVLAQKYPCH